MLTKSLGHFLQELSELQWPLEGNNPAAEKGERSTLKSLLSLSVSLYLTVSLSYHLCHSVSLSPPLSLSLLFSLSLFVTMSLSPLLSVSLFLSQPLCLFSISLILSLSQTDR